MTTKNTIFAKPVRLAVAVHLACLSSAAVAFDFDIYEIDASLSTTLTAGIGVRLEDTEQSLTSQGNLGPDCTSSNVGA